MLTVIETPMCLRCAAKVSDHAERDDFMHGWHLTQQGETAPMRYRA